MPVKKVTGLIKVHLGLENSGLNKPQKHYKLISAIQLPHRDYRVKDSLSKMHLGNSRCLRETIK
jgi:hypothetical protein